MNEIKLFENKQIRSAWDEEREEWLFSVVDVIAVLTQSANPRRYWSDLKRKIAEDEGYIQLYENIVQLCRRDLFHKLNANMLSQHSCDSFANQPALVTIDGKFGGIADKKQLYNQTATADIR